MTAPVQINEASNAAAASTIGVAQSVNPTVGYTNVVWVRGPSGATVPSVEDSLGNVYTPRGNVAEAGTSQVLYQFTAPITTGGAPNTVTANYGGSTTQRGIAVALCAGTYDNANTGTDTGNNPTTSVAATNAAQPATVLMLCNFVQGGTPGVGTGFTDAGLVWGTVGLNARVQYKEVTTTASQSGNFVNPALDRNNTGLIILDDLVTPQFSVQPTDQVVVDGGTATFLTTVVGADTLQWETQAPEGGTWSNVSGGTGATTDDYTTGALSRVSDAGRLFRLRADNAFGTTYSRAVAAIVQASPSSFTAANRVGNGKIGALKLGGGTIVGGQTASITEAGTASDSSSAVLVAAATITEAGSGSDTSDASGGQQTADVTETGAASDSSSAVQNTTATITETGTAADSSSASGPGGSAVPNLVAAVGTGSPDSDGAVTSAIDTTGATGVRVVVVSQANNLTNGALTDNKSNAFEIEAGPINVGTFPGYLYVYRPTAAPNVGTNHIFTLTATSSFASVWPWAVGPSAGGTVSISAVSTNIDADAPFISNSITPAQPNARLIAFCADDSSAGNVNYTWTSPFTAISGATINDQNSFWGGSLAQQAVTSSGSYSAQCSTIDTGGGAAMAIFSVTETVAGAQSADITETGNATDSSSTGAQQTASITEAGSGADSSTAAKTATASITEGGTPSLGAHGISPQLDGAGTSPNTLTRDTALSGSTFVVLGLGQFTNFDPPTDNKSNTVGSALESSGYGGGLWPGFGGELYVYNGAGGAGHVWTLVKPLDAAAENSLVVVEVLNGGVIQDTSVVARTRIGALQPQSSATVTTTGPALLVALWSGDGEVGVDMSGTFGNGFSAVDTNYIDGVAYIQCASAIRAVDGPGDYSFSFTPDGNQGGIFFLVAIQSANASAGDTSSAVKQLVSAITEAAAGADASSVVAAFLSAIAEAGAATDASTAAQVHVATRTETNAGADASTAVQVHAAAQSETGNAQDASSTGAQQTASATEAGAATDASTAAASFVATVSEAGTGAESSTAILGAQAQQSEAGAATDASTAAAQFSASVTETGVATEASSTGAQQTASITEPGTAADASAALMLAVAAVAEAAAGADASTALAILAAAITEAGNATEASSTGAQQFASITEPGAAADSSSGAASFVATVLEAGAAAEASTAAASLAATITEPGAATDSSSATASFVAAIQEAGAATDTVTAFSNLLTAAITEAANATDSTSAATIFAGTVLEAAAGSEASIAVLLGLASILEASVALDIVSAGGQQTASITEPGAAGDSSSAGKFFIENHAEVANAADVVSALYVALASVLEGADAQDVSSALATFSAAIVESGNATSFEATGSVLLADITESGNATDLNYVVTAMALLRTFFVPRENRIVAVSAEDRRVSITAEDRTLDAGSENRTINRS